MRLPYRPGRLGVTQAALSRDCLVRLLRLGLYENCTNELPIQLDQNVALHQVENFHAHSGRPVAAEKPKPIEAESRGPRKHR
jgi:hypothetical protein